MGELVPIIVLIFISIVIVSCLFVRKHLSIKQVVKPLSEVEMVERDRYTLNREEAEKLHNALTVMLSKNKMSDSYDLLMEDKILTIEIRTKKA